MTSKEELEKIPAPFIEIEKNEKTGRINVACKNATMRGIIAAWLQMSLKTFFQKIKK